MSYLKRSIEPVIQRAVREFPAVILTGPRQAGKTTLLKHLFSETHRYVSLEPPDFRAAAQSDPRGFLALYPPPVIFDEVQYCPELLPYIKELIDSKRNEYGKFILTGSQNLLLQEKVSESLAGRAAILKILNLTLAEIDKEPGARFPWETSNISSRNVFGESLWKLLLRGTYPELIAQPERDASLWLGSYIQTYLERDVRMIRQVGDLTQFQLFLRAVAARSGQLFVLSDVAKDIGIAVNTVRNWLAVLEATHQVIILRPYYANISKRLVKSPKVYFTDTGILSYLLGLRELSNLMSSPFLGPIFESFVISQVYKRMINRGLEPSLYFWRTASGSEVDLLIEDQGALYPIEIKSNATPKPSMSQNLVALKKDLKERLQKGYVVHMGENPLPLSPEILAIPVSAF